MEVYLDNAATTMPYDEVINAVAFNMKNNFANPSAKHLLGLKAERLLNESREKIAYTLNCSKDEIIFTSGGSESNNLAIKGFAKPGCHMITSVIEHSSVLKTFKELEDEGVSVSYIKVDDKGRLDLHELENSINKDTVLISIMHVNNEIGTIQDLEAIGALIRKKSQRAKFHVDAVQSYGKFNIDVQRCNIDLLSISAHKFHGPRGVGAIYIKKALYPKALITGGGQEKGYRSGTENVAGTSGMAMASEMMYENIIENYNKVTSIKAYFIDKLQEVKDISINSPLEEHVSSYILNVSFKGVRGEVLLHLLEEKGIYVSTGSACSSKSKKSASVLKALGLSDKDIEGTLRFSFNEKNTKEEIDYVIENLKQSLNFLRRVRK